MSKQRDALATQPSSLLMWRPGPAQGESHEFIFGDGDQYLMAVSVCRDSGKPERGYVTEYSAITVRCGENYFALEEAGESWGWEWSDVEWFAPLDGLNKREDGPQ